MQIDSIRFDSTFDSIRFEQASISLSIYEIPVSVCMAETLSLDDRLDALDPLDPRGTRTRHTSIVEPVKEFQTGHVKFALCRDAVLSQPLLLLGTCVSHALAHLLVAGGCVVLYSSPRFGYFRRASWFCRTTHRPD